jgi:hypothetical protein
MKISRRDAEPLRMTVDRQVSVPAQHFGEALMKAETTR